MKQLQLKKSLRMADAREQKEVYMIWSKELNGWSDGRDCPRFNKETQRGCIWMSRGSVKGHVTRVVKRNSTIYLGAEIVTFKPTNTYEPLAELVNKINMMWRL